MKQITKYNANFVRSDHPLILQSYKDCKVATGEGEHNLECNVYCKVNKGYIMTLLLILW